MEKILLALAELRAEFKNFFTASAETAAKLTANAAEIAGLKSELTARDATIKDLTAKLETAQNEVNSKGTEIAALNKSLEEAKTKADSTLAAMGVDPKAIPAPKPEEAAKGGILAEHEALKSDPVAYVEFYRKHKATIDAAYRNAQ